MMFIKRSIAYLIDYAIISIPNMILCMVIGSIPALETNGDFPFLVISYMFMPHVFWGNLIIYPGCYGSLGWLPCIVSVSVLFESLIYSLQVYFRQCTIGMKVTQLRITTIKQCNHNFLRLLIWNVLKVSNKYLFAMPFLFGMLTKRKTTVYDFITGVEVQ